MNSGHRTREYTSPTYHSWTAMKNRCQSPTSKDWLRYGGRGITVCERWQTFALFLEDMGEKPGKGWTIERKQVNGNYETSNCEWATRKTQSLNRTNTKLITHDGKTQTEAEWAREYGISRGRLHYRLSIGLPMAQALMSTTLPTGGPSKKSKS